MRPSAFSKLEQPRTVSLAVPQPLAHNPLYKPLAQLMVTLAATVINAIPLAPRLLEHLSGIVQEGALSDRLTTQRGRRHCEARARILHIAISICEVNLPRGVHS